MQTNNTPPTITKDQKMSSVAFGVLLIFVLFALPLGLVYNFLYYKSKSFSAFWLFWIVLLLGYTTNLLFYRVVLMNDKKAQIDKMQASTASYVFGITISSFMIMGFTLFMITINSNLVKVFENSIGLWFAGFWGLKDLANDIFSSKMLAPFKNDIDDKYSNVFNYGFLLSRFDQTNIRDENFKNIEADFNKFNAALDFTMKFAEDETVKTHQQMKLKELVSMKNTVGHFFWIYLSSIISLFVSMIAMFL